MLKILLGVSRGARHEVVGSVGILVFIEDLGRACLAQVYLPNPEQLRAKGCLGCLLDATRLCFYVTQCNTLGTSNCRSYNTNTALGYLLSHRVPPRHHHHQSHPHNHHQNHRDPAFPLSQIPSAHNTAHPHSMKSGHQVIKTVSHHQHSQTYRQALLTTYSTTTHTTEHQLSPSSQKNKHQHTHRRLLKGGEKRNKRKLQDVLLSHLRCAAPAEERSWPADELGFALVLTSLVFLFSSFSLVCWYWEGGRGAGGRKSSRPCRLRRENLGLDRRFSGGRGFGLFLLGGTGGVSWVGLCFWGEREEGGRRGDGLVPHWMQIGRGRKPQSAIVRWIGLGLIVDLGGGICWVGGRKWDLIV